MLLAGFVGPSAVAENRNADCEDTMNLFVSPLDPSGAGRLTDAVLLPCPGFRTRWTLEPGPIRCEFTEPKSGRMFVISGYKLFELFADYTSIERGTVSLNANPATIAANSAVGELFIWSGNVGYCYTLATNTLTTVLASGATIGGFLDGRFISLDTSTSTFSISDLNDGLTWDPTQFAQRFQAGDPWVSLLIVNQDIWLFGTETSEVWYDAGTFPFPFAPRPDALIQHGTNAPYSPNAVNDLVIWVAQNRQGANTIVRSDGYRGVPLSTLSVDRSLQEMSNTTDAQSFVYQQHGHNFYVVNFPSGDLAWAWDLTTSMWCKRGFWSSPANTYQPYRVSTHAFAFGLHLVGDRLTGVVYELTTELATDVDGSGIRRYRRFMGVTGENHTRVTYPRLEVEMETGLAPLSGQGSDPVMMLKCSNDHGHTWQPEVWSAAGVRGAYSARVFWTRLGQARDRVFEIAMSDPLPWRLTRAWVPDVQEDAS